MPTELEIVARHQTLICYVAVDYQKKLPGAKSNYTPENDHVRDDQLRVEMAAPLDRRFHRRLHLDYTLHRHPFSSN